MATRKKTRKKKPPSTARKQPHQSRAKATVDAILEATTHLLIKGGYDRLTTNHVAARAGVSIGSVYMYFPSKEAIVAALLDRHMERIASLMGNEIALTLHQPLVEGVERVIDALVRVNASVEPELHRALQEQLPRIGAFDKIRAFDRSFETLLAATLEARASEHRASDAKLAAFMIVQSVKAITLEAAHEHSKAVKDGRLARELARMIIGYLKRDDADVSR